MTTTHPPTPALESAPTARRMDDCIALYADFETLQALTIWGEIPRDLEDKLRAATATKNGCLVFVAPGDLEILFDEAARFELTIRAALEYFA